MKKLTLIILLVQLNIILKAQDCPMEMGINLYSNVNWSREMPFANLMFQADNWVTQNQNFVPDGINAFNTGVIDSIILDENGYPFFLPQQVTGTEAYQSLITLLVKDNGGIHPDGNYTLTYKGHGEVILVGADVSSLVSAENNKRVYHIVVQDKGDIGLKIINSDINDPIHDVKVLLPGHDETDVFNKDFLDKMSQFNTVRFMNWQKTNSSNQIQWSSRASPDYYTMNTASGVPLDYMIQLCNINNSNIWINIPHQADENYVKSLAQKLKQELNSNLHIYAEYSNEVWNVSFPQHDWVDENAPANLLSPEQKYAYFTKKSFTAFSEIFQDDMSRITRVLSGQQINPNVINRSTQAMKDQFAVDLYDAISCTGSFSLTPQQKLTMDENTTVEDIAVNMRTNINEIYKTSMLHHKTKADTLNKGFVGYESSGLASVSYLSPELRPAFADAIDAYNQDTSMYNIYTEWLKFLRDEVRIDLCCSFVLADDNKAAYGSYGHLNSIFETEPYSLAFQAISSVNCELLGAGNSQSEEVVNIYPNPTNSIIKIDGPVNYFKMFDMNGRLLLNGCVDPGNSEIEISSLNPGVYLLQIRGNAFQKTEKVIKL